MWTIVVGAPTCADAVNEYKCCLEEFHKKKILVKKADRIRTRIETSNCIIMFESTNPPDRLRGLRADAVFGFSKEDQCYYTQSHQATDYNGTFLDYVYEVEGVKE